MKTVKVSAPSKTYDILIGEGLLPALGEAVRQLRGKGKSLLVCGPNVASLYEQQALLTLREAGIETAVCHVPEGEAAKSFSCYEALLHACAERQLSRSDSLVALGGGVTGDLTGFAAASYQRGIGFIQVPTTLLAAVDSSVGGKTAINLPEAKNQVGAFYQPDLVLCDTDCLKTLPEREMRAGMAEVIKYAVIGSRVFFDRLNQGGVPIDEIIETCVRMKAEIVAEDEQDLGRRRLLNLGHSFGHAVESRSGYSLRHGEAVAIGMAMISRAAFRRGLMEKTEKDRLIALLEKSGLPVSCEYGPDELIETLRLDKKISGDTISLVIPQRIGESELMKVPVSDLHEWLEEAYE